MCCKSKFIKDIVKTINSTKGYERLLQCVNILSCEDGQCIAEFEVQEEHFNVFKTLHGGYIATLVDCISTFALMGSKRKATGVSVDMHIRYLKAAFEGDCVVVQADVVKAGRTLAFLDVQLCNKKTGAILATGSHTKFVGGQ